MACCSAIRDVLTWKNHATSVASLVALNLLYFLLFVVNKSLVSMACWVCLFLLAIGFFLKCVDAPASDKGPVEVISRDTIEENLLFLYDFANDAASNLRNIVLWKEFGTSFKVLGAVWGLGFIASFFSFATLSFLCLWGVFIWSLVEQQYMELVKPIIVKGHDSFWKLFSMIPRMQDLRKTE